MPFGERICRFLTIVVYLNAFKVVLQLQTEVTAIDWIYYCMHITSKARNTELRIRLLPVNFYKKRTFLRSNASLYCHLCPLSVTSTSFRLFRIRKFLWFLWERLLFALRRNNARLSLPLKYKLQSRYFLWICRCFILSILIATMIFKSVIIENSICLLVPE